MTYRALKFQVADSNTRSRGFTLIELMMAVGITAILGSVAASTYRLYVVRGQAAQTLTDYGHIRTVVAVETQAGGASNLQQDSVPGAVPPKLRGELDTREFNGPDGQQLQLVVAPAGTFASYPDQDVYALVDAAPGVLGELRLRVLRHELPHAEGDKVWLSSNELIWPLDSGSGGAPAVAAATPPAPGTASAGSSGSSSGGSSSGTSSGESSSNSASPPSPAPSGSSSNSSSNSSSPPSSAPSGSSAAGAGATTVTGTVTRNGGSWTGNVEICVGAAGGGPLTGYDNINVVYQVVTQYSTFQENLQISSITGCVSKSYSGLPDGSNVQIQILNVLNYTVSGTTSTPLWNGATPSLTLASP